MKPYTCMLLCHALPCKEAGFNLARLQVMRSFSRRLLRRLRVINDLARPLMVLVLTLYICIRRPFTNRRHLTILTRVLVFRVFFPKFDPYFTIETLVNINTNMSLDKLFQQIIFAEQLFSGKITKLHEVKVSVVRCKDQIKASNEKLIKNNQELFNKTQQLYEMKLQHDLMKKQEQQTERQLKELLLQQVHLKEHLDQIRTKASEEQEQFLEEIRRFNCSFSLVGNRESVSGSQAQAEILHLQKDVDSIYKEMELENQKNGRMNSMLENKALLVELKYLENSNKDLDLQITKAKEVTESLRAESLMVSLKPQTDSTCLRLKKELELLKEGDLELVREALSAEIGFLQSKLDTRVRSQLH